MKTRELVKLFISFKTSLAKERKKLAVMQLTGKIEDVLTREFAFHIVATGKGNYFPLMNYGEQGERKYDLCILKRRYNDPLGPLWDPVITTFIEAKYISNILKEWDWDKGSKKFYFFRQTGTGHTFRKLKSQLRCNKSFEHGGYTVSAEANRHSFGLVFVSFVWPKNKRLFVPTKSLFSIKKDYFNYVKDNAAKHFVDVGHGRPKLVTVYNDTDANLLGITMRTSLKMGLWMRK